MMPSAHPCVVLILQVWQQVLIHADLEVDEGAHTTCLDGHDVMRLSSSHLVVKAPEVHLLLAVPDVSLQTPCGTTGHSQALGVDKVYTSTFPSECQ